MPTAKQQRFLAAYAECHVAFQRYASTVAFGKCDVADLTQDVMLSAFKHFDGIAEGKLLHYLIRAARNRSISLGRNASSHFSGRGRGCDEPFGEQCLQRLRARGAAPDALLETEALYRALHQLPDKQRNAVVLFELNGFSVREVAGLQGCSEASVKMKLSRGRRRLCELLVREERSLTRLLSSAKTLLL